jgi:putative FmdB family regulatory protein
MPLYEYHCPKCGKDFETLVRACDPEIKCKFCEDPYVVLKPSVWGSYAIKGDNSASTRPRRRR